MPQNTVAFPNAMASQQQQMATQSQFLSFLEASTRAMPLRELRSAELNLSRSNPFQRKTIANLPGGDQTFQTALYIETTFAQQDKDLSEIDKAMKELEKETSELRN